jgi:GDPmannose 4,6-dehydratase
VLRNAHPSEIYYLPAVHQSSQDPVTADDAALFNRSIAVHMTGLVNILEELRAQELDAGVFYAASSLVFGDVTDERQNEQTPLRPNSIYGITKSAGVHACQFYRQAHGVRASAGFLYNHESSLRRASFVSQRIARGAVAIARGTQQTLTVGDLSARIDWGYAPDFIDAMIRINRMPIADDYIVATGEAHTVEEFISAAFARLGLDWRTYVREDHSLLTRTSPTRIGDSTHLRSTTGWKPTVSFTEMVDILVDAAAESAAAEPRFAKPNAGL